MAQSGAVHNRLIALQQPLSAGQLEHAANYLNSLIANRTLAEARARLRTELERDRRELGELQARALALGAEAVQVEAPTVHIEGQSSFLDDKALAQDLMKIRALFRALDEKELLLAVLDRTLAAEELRIFIGAESGIVEPDLAIGYRFRDNGFKGGMVDEFCVFNRALTAAEVFRKSRRESGWSLDDDIVSP